MKLKDYLRTREGALAENRVGRLSILILVVANVLLVGALAAKSQTVVLVPPTLEERSVVDARAASDEMKVAWGLYLAGTLGNVTPRSSEFLKTNVSRFLSPRLYRSVVDGIEQQATQIREEQITLQFMPTLAKYDPEIEKVVVTGELVIRGLRGAERREIRTYEMGFIVRDYTVLLDELRVIDGAWKKAPGTEAN